MAESDVQVAIKRTQLAIAVIHHLAIGGALEPGADGEFTLARIDEIAAAHVQVMQGLDVLFASARRLHPLPADILPEEPTT